MELNSRIKELEQETSEKESRLVELKSEISLMRDFIETGEKRERRASELARRIGSLESELETSNSKAEQSVRRLSEFKKQAEEEGKRELSVYEEKIKDLENQIGVISREDKLQTQNEALEKRLRDEIHASFEKERLRLCNEVEELRSRAEALESEDRQSEAERTLKKMSVEYEEMKRRVQEAEEELERERAASRRRRLSISNPTLAPTKDESIRHDAKLIARKASLFVAKRDVAIHELEMEQQRKTIDREMELKMKNLEDRTEDHIVSLFEQKVGLTPSPLRGGSRNVLT